MDVTGAVENKLHQNRPRRILSIDGGGIRCMIALEILLSLENQIIEQTGDPSRRLSDQFDLIAGTSAGAMLAGAIAMGSSMTDVRDFVLANSKLMFKPTRWYNRYRSLYDKAELEQHMRDWYGADTTLGSDKLKTLLLMVMRNWSTDSPWLVSNNPHAIFNQPDLDDCNLHLPLWQLVRASAAAPAYYVPETITFGQQNQYEFIFVDGGLTGFVNPAFKAFQYVTNGAYGLNWKATEEQLTIVSVGSGDIRHKKLSKTEKDINVFKSVLGIPNAMIYATTREQDLLCRTFGRCLTGESIDLEVSDMKQTSFPLESRMFRYHRINPVISDSGLKEIGCGHIRPKDVASIDKVDNVGQMAEVGQAMSGVVGEVLGDCL